MEVAGDKLQVASMSPISEMLMVDVAKSIKPDPLLGSLSIPVLYPGPFGYVCIGKLGGLMGL